MPAIVTMTNDMATSLCMRGFPFRNLFSSRIRSGFIIRLPVLSVTLFFKNNRLRTEMMFYDANLLPGR